MFEINNGVVKEVVSPVNVSITKAIKGMTQVIMKTAGCEYRLMKHTTSDQAEKVVARLHKATFNGKVSLTVGLWLKRHNDSVVRYRASEKQQNFIKALAAKKSAAITIPADLTKDEAHSLIQFLSK